MKTLKFLLYATLFFLIGEFIVRLDMKYDVLNNSPNKIEIKVEKSELRSEIEQGNFIPNSNQIRVLILGDSYINGGGISAKNKFSKKLSQLLENSYSKEILILDISRPSNSTLDNYNSFKFYENKFKPQFVFWAYNFNDILYSIPKEIPTEIAVAAEVLPKRLPKKRNGLKKFVLQVYSFSELTRYLSKNIQKQLKFRGIVIPVGDFHHLTKQAYLETSEPWINTQKLLKEVSLLCKKNQADFILYKMPEFNLLNHPNLFQSIDTAIDNFVESNKNITYFNGISDFKNEDGNKFMLSKYDGHPNELAHMRIAEKIAEYIKTETAHTASLGKKSATSFNNNIETNTPE